MGACCPPRPGAAATGTRGGEAAEQPASPAGFPRLAEESSERVRDRAQDPQCANGAGSVGVFRRDGAGVYTEVARLLASDAVEGASLGGDVDLDGRRVAATARDAGYIFRLPAKLLEQP